MGIYTTPYEHFGRLSYEMWRACRLVVDTGIHYFGWSREKAEACFLENSALAEHNVKTEVARYISWPGQALAYKTGELLIRDLRDRAEKRLGDDFDLRGFPRPHPGRRRDAAGDAGSAHGSLDSSQRREMIQGPSLRDVARSCRWDVSRPSVPEAYAFVR